MGVLDGSSYFDGGLALDEDRAVAVITEKIARPLGLELDASLINLERAYDSKIAGLLAEQVAEVADVALLAFGGAGPMSACGVAEAAGIAEVIVPKQAAVFSAFGISFSDISHSYRTTVAPGSADSLLAKIAALRLRAERDMFAEGYDIADCGMEAWMTQDDGPSIPIGIDAVAGRQEASAGRNSSSAQGHADNPPLCAEGRTGKHPIHTSGSRPHAVGTWSRSSPHRCAGLPAGGPHTRYLRSRTGPDRGQILHVSGSRRLAVRHPQAARTFDFAR